MVSRWPRPEPPPSTKPPTSSEAAIGASAIRKATLRLIPLIALGYGAAYMDRVNISFASLQMNRDLHFSATTYGFGAGLFFLSYAACEVPSNLLLYRFGARRWLARIMVTWGLLAIGMLFVRTPAQFYTMRFLLGMSEAGFFPGVVFYLMQWFPPQLRARTISRFYISLPLSSVFMGLIAGALLNLDGQLGLRGWQWLFLVEGLPAVLLGIVFFFFLPDSPAHAPWLTEDERHWIIRAVTRSSSHPPTTATPSVRVLTTRASGSSASSCSSCLPASTPTPSSRRTSSSAPPTSAPPTSASSSPASISSERRHAVCNRPHPLRPHALARYRHIIPWGLLISLGFLVCGLSTIAPIVVPALGLLIIAYNAMQGPLWSLPASFFKGRSAAAGIAAVNMIGITGGFLGPYFIGFAKDLTGDYQRGLLLMSLPMLLGAESCSTSASRAPRPTHRLGQLK